MLEIDSVDSESKINEARVDWKSGIFDPERDEEIEAFKTIFRQNYEHTRVK